FFERAREMHFHRLKDGNYFDLTLAQRVRAIVRSTVAFYRTNRGLLRAPQRYASTHPDTAVRRSVRKENRARLHLAATRLLAQRDQRHHPHPEAAVELALLAIGSVLNTIVLDDESAGDVRLDEELTRMTLAYLG